MNSFLFDFKVFFSLYWFIIVLWRVECVYVLGGCFGRGCGFFGWSFEVSELGSGWFGGISVLLVLSRNNCVVFLGRRF